MASHGFGPQENSSPRELRCPRCLFKFHLERLRKTLDESTPLDQNSYRNLHELLADQHKHPTITIDLVRGAREEVHRLNLKKVRYEDLVEAFQNEETKLDGEELEELQMFLRVFDYGNLGMRDNVGKTIDVKAQEEEANKEKRKGIIGTSPGSGGEVQSQVNNSPGPGSGSSSWI